MSFAPAAIERILQRLCISRNGAATPAGVQRWAIEFEDGAEPPTMLSFKHGVSSDGLELSCDAPLERYTAEQATVVAAFQTELATALVHEKIQFRSFADVAAFVDDYYDAELHVEDGYVIVDPEGFPVTVTGPLVSREPWIEVSTPFDPDANPAWLLEKNGEMTSVRFEVASGGSVGLVAAFPIPVLTAQRLIEMIDDVAVMFGALLEEYEADDEDEEDEDEDDEVWTRGAIIGPWPDKTSCLRALDDSLLRSGHLKLGSREPGCEVAHVVRIGATMWVAVDPPILIELARSLDKHRVFAADIDTSDDGTRAVRAHLIELAIDEDGGFALHANLGSEPETREPNLASRAWEIRLAARAVGAPESVDAPSKAIYYRAL